MRPRPHQGGNNRIIPSRSPPVPGSAPDVTAAAETERYFAGKRRRNHHHRVSVLGHVHHSLPAPRRDRIGDPCETDKRRAGRWWRPDGIRRLPAQLQIQSSYLKRETRLVWRAVIFAFTSDSITWLLILVFNLLQAEKQDAIATSSIRFV